MTNAHQVHLLLAGGAHLPIIVLSSMTVQEEVYYLSEMHVVQAINGSPIELLCNFASCEKFCTILCFKTLIY